MSEILRDFGSTSFILDWEQKGAIVIGVNSTWTTIKDFEETKCWAAKKTFNYKQEVKTVETSGYQNRTTTLYPRPKTARYQGSYQGNEQNKVNASASLECINTFHSPPRQSTQR